MKVKLLWEVMAKVLVHPKAQRDNAKRNLLGQVLSSSVLGKKRAYQTSVGERQCSDTRAI